MEQKMVVWLGAGADSRGDRVGDSVTGSSSGRGAASNAGERGERASR